MATTCVYNVFVGAETGLLKGIQTAEHSWQNLNSVADTNRSREITSLCWGNSDQTELCAGLRDNCVLTFDAAGASATEQGPFFGASGHIKTIAKYGDRFLTGFSDGLVAVWSGDGDEDDSLKISTGDNLWAVAQNSAEPNLIATGGKENPLKLWDVNCQDPVFTSKNVKNDWLNLRVPIWVTKIQFCADNRRMIAATGYNQVRVYDPKVCRRPVIDFNVLKDSPLTALSVCPMRNDQIVVGTTKGDMALVDLRKCQLVHLFRGFSGGITDVQCHATAPVVISSSVDRFVRVHDIESKALLDKFYLKSRLNCLLLSNEWPQNEENSPNTQTLSKAHVQNSGEKQTDINENEDAFWEQLEDVETKTAKETKGKEGKTGKERKGGREQKRKVDNNDSGDEERDTLTCGKKPKRQNDKKKKTKTRA